MNNAIDVLPYYVRLLENGEVVPGKEYLGFTIPKKDFTEIALSILKFKIKTGNDAILIICHPDDVELLSKYSKDLTLVFLKNSGNPMVPKGMYLIG